MDNAQSTVPQRAAATDVASHNEADRPARQARPPDGSPIVITVHGTFSSDPADEGNRWWQRGSAFTARLRERLAAKGVGDAEIEPFHWTGDNSDHARLAAADELARRLETHAASGRPIAVLAHSHGGNVLMEGLVQRRRRPPLAAAVTFGTPFFVRRLKPIPTLIAAFQILLGLAVSPAMAMYSWYALRSTIGSGRIELLVVALIGLALMVWALVRGVRRLIRQRRARARTRSAIAPEDWLVLHSPRDEAMRLLETAAAVNPIYVTSDAARRQITRFAVVAGVAGTLVFLYLLGAYLTGPLIDKLMAGDFGKGLLADLTILLTVPVVYGLVYGAFVVFAWLGGAHLLSGLLNNLIHNGIVGAAYGGDEAYALTGVHRVPPYLPGAREQGIVAANLGGINEDDIVESARELYASVVSDDASDVAFGDPDQLWKRLNDALYHNAYMRDAGVVDAVADFLAARVQG